MKSSDALDPERPAEGDGLPSDLVEGIVADAAGRLWVSTNRGLVRFDPRRRAFKVYTRVDGLHGNEFLMRSAFRAGDGTLYFGSMATGTIYRAAPGAARAEPWILASAAGLTNVLGVLADDRTNTLWVCQNAAGGRGGAPEGDLAAAVARDFGSFDALKAAFAEAGAGQFGSDRAAVTADRDGG